MKCIRSGSRISIFLFLCLVIFNSRIAEAGSVPTLLVLDAATGQPIPNCPFRFDSWRPASTDDNGMYRCVGQGFDIRLAEHTPLRFWHPDYECMRSRSYRSDSDGSVTISLRQSGTATLTIDTADMDPQAALETGQVQQYRLLVRQCQSQTLVRQCPMLSPETSYRFSGLAGGRYSVQVDRWDGKVYQIRYGDIDLEEGQDLYLAAGSLPLRRRKQKISPIPCAGRVLDKHTGKPLNNVRVLYGRSGAW